MGTEIRFTHSGRPHGESARTGHGRPVDEEAPAGYSAIGASHGRSSGEEGRTPAIGHEFVYTVRCVHCGAHQEMPSFGQTYPSHLQRGRKKVLCPWSNTRLSVRQMQDASRRIVKKPVAPASTVTIPRTPRKPDRSASKSTAKAPSQKAKTPQTPPQRRGRVVSSTRSTKNSSATDRGAAAWERRRERRYFTSEYGDIGDDRFRERGELNADSVSVSARLGPSQGTGRRR